MGLHERPVVVCLCGSTRFMDAFAEAQRRETLAGKIVLSVGLSGHQEGLDMNGPVKKMLDELHLRKIDLADEVLVLDVLCQVCSRCGTVWTCRVEMCGCGQDLCGVSALPYVGESTRREVAYAKARGKRLRYLSAERAETP